MRAIYQPGPSLVSSPKSESKGFLVSPVSLRFKGSTPRRFKPEPPPRCPIYQFSDNSRRKLRFTALNAWPQLISQFCLTYHHNFPNDGQVLKAHFHKFRDSMRKVLGISSYLWILEFQRRGAPHFHLFLGVSPSPELGQRLADLWLKASGQQDDSQARAFHIHSSNFITWKMGNGAYLCKYLEKARQKDVPDNFQNVGRFWGCSRGLVPMPQDVPFDDFAAAHEWADEKTGVCSDAVILAARWLGKWYERQRPKKYRKFSRNFRKMALKTGWTLATGASAFRQIERYLWQQSQIYKTGGIDYAQAKLAALAQRKTRRKYIFEAPPLYSDAIADYLQSTQLLYEFTY